MKETNKIKIVFVCLGNYCRSPMAEAIFNKLAKSDDLQMHFDISSAGTKGWDVGLQPDLRTQKLLKEHHYPLDPDKRARRITQKEINASDFLIAMSQRVADDLDGNNNVHLLMDFVQGSEGEDIPDPYPTNTFLQAFTMIERGVKAFYKEIKHKFFIEQTDN